MTEKDSARFKRLAQEQRPSLLAKWWLLPIVLVLLLLGLIVLLAGTSAAPFIYTIF